MEKKCTESLSQIFCFKRWEKIVFGISLSTQGNRRRIFRKIEACWRELEQLVQKHLASQGSAAGVPQEQGGGDAGRAKLSKGAKKNLKKKAKKAAAGGGQAGADDSD